MQIIQGYKNGLFLPLDGFLLWLPQPYEIKILFLETPYFIFNFTEKNVHFEINKSTLTL
jgi:hypothetical protein